jgi:glycine cleavage system H protein
VAINESLNGAPELVNSEPYGAGWYCEIELEGALPALLNAAQYGEITA